MREPIFSTYPNFTLFNMQPKPLITTNGVLRFENGLIIIDDRISWFKRKGFVLYAMFFSALLSLVIGYILDIRGQLIFGSIALVVLFVLLFFSLKTYKGKNEVEHRLIETANIRSVVFKTTLLSKYINIYIFLPDNKYSKAEGQKRY